jgi:hypothetical protein
MSKSPPLRQRLQTVIDAGRAARAAGFRRLRVTTMPDGTTVVDLSQDDVDPNPPTDDAVEVNDFDDIWKKRKTQREEKP